MGTHYYKKLKAYIERKRNYNKLRRSVKEENIPPAIPPLMVKVNGEMVIDPSLELDKKGSFEVYEMEEISFDGKE